MPISPRAKTLAFATLFLVIVSLAWSNAFFEIFSGIFLGLFLISFLGSPERGFLKSLFVGFILLYLLMNLLSITQSSYLGASWRGMFKVLRSALLCLGAIYVVDDESKFRRIFQWFLSVAFVVGLDAWVQGMTGVELLRGRPMTPYLGEVRRLTGPFRHANDFSAYLTFVFFLYLGVMREGLKLFGWKKHLFFIAGFLLCLFSLIGTYSRGAWLSVGAAFFLFVLVKKSKILAAVLLTLLAWGIFASPPLIRERLHSLGDPRNTTILERVELWQESLKMIADRPVLGMGVNTYAKNEPFYKTKDSKIDFQYSHNGYLQIAAETGLLGIGSFLLVISYFGWASFRAFRRTSNLWLGSAGMALLFGILSFLIHSATDTNLQSLLLVNTLWLAMGIAWAGKNLAEGHPR